MTDAKADITVVVPTALHSARADSIERAVESILSQSGVRAIPLLVVNGPAYDRDLLRRWQSDPRVRCHYLQTGSLPGAIRHGRSLVETPYFSFLDDDDLYEPNTLRVRVEAFDADGAEQPDVVVCNGLREVGERVTRCFRNMSAYGSDPLRALLDQNWLASCGGTFRSASVGVEYFDGVTKYLEWTTTAFHCATRLKIHFIETLAYRLFDSEVSLSKSVNYRRGVVDGLGVIAKLELPADVRAAVLRKRSHALHELSDWYRLEGRLANAWGAHLNCVRGRDGLRYLTFTLRLLYSTLTGRGSRPA